MRNKSLSLLLLRSTKATDQSVQEVPGPLPDRQRVQLIHHPLPVAGPTLQQMTIRRPTVRPFCLQDIRNTIENVVTSTTKDIDPFHFLQALSDEMLNNPDPSLRPHGRQLQAVIPNLFGSDAESDDVEMGPPPTGIIMSEKARGKQRDISKSTTSRSNSVSKPSDLRSTASPPGPSAHLFVKKGRPYRFYVQADYYHRKDLVKSIRVRYYIFIASCRCIAYSADRNMVVQLRAM